MSNQQRITIVEVNQGFCTHTYGVAPCTAVLGTTGNHKCFNTEATCQAPAQYDGDPNAVPYLSLPGIFGNFAETPDSAALDLLTGDLDFRIKVSCTDWTPALGFDFLDKLVSDVSQFSFLFRLNTTGILTLYWSADGVTLSSLNSTVATGVADGATKWLRVILDVDNGAGNSVATFYTSDDGIIWTQLGAQAFGSVTSIFAGTATLQVGGGRSGIAGFHQGKTFYAELRSGINGPVVAKFDPPFNDAAYSASSFVSETGERWTINTSGGTPAKLICPAVQLRFTQPQDGISQYGLLIPSLQSAGITPAEINLAAMERNAGALGQREVITAQMIDHQHSDLIVDRYRLERETGAATNFESGTSQGLFALQFNGTTQYATAAPLVNGITSSSIEGRVRITSLAAFQVLMVIGPNGSANARRLDVNTNGSLSGNYGGSLVNSPVGVIAVGRDVHVCTTYDGIAKRLYVDGVQVGYDAAVIGAVGSNLINFGSSQNNAEFTTGQLSGIKVYSRALTGDEVAQHAAGIFNDETGLLGAWLLNDGSGAVGVDSSGLGHNATLFNSPTWVAGLGISDKLRLRSAAVITAANLIGKTVHLTDGTNRERTAIAYIEALKIARLDSNWPTNLVPWSESPSVHWSATQITSIVDNYYIDKDGVALAKVIPNLVNGSHFVRPDTTLLITGRRYVFGVRAKAAGFNLLSFETNVGGFSVPNFNLTTGVVTQNPGSVATMTHLGDGVYLCLVYYTTGNTNTPALFLPAYGSGAGDNNSGILMGGAFAVEVKGSPVPVYIKTPGAAVIDYPTSATGYDIRQSYTPFKQGTFWGKWIARNPYYSNFPVTMREGLVGQLLSAMRVHKYSIDRFEGPTAGAVSMVAKDLFTKIEQRKSVAPLASSGRLLADITNVATSATLTPAGVGNLEYPASGFVVISEEEMSFTRAADVLTLTRATSNTTAAAHKADDLVQLVLVYTPTLVKDIVYDLLSKYTQVKVSQLPLAEWTAAMTAVSELYSAHICAPTPVLDLVGELSEQAGFTVFPNTVTGFVKMVPLRAGAAALTIDDAKDMVSGSISVKRQDSRRASQVWVYYAQRNPVKKLDEKTNYASRTLNVSLAAETQYGTPAIREVLSRWIPAGGRAAALKTGGRMLELFRNPPIEAQFRVITDDWDSQLSLAQFITPMIDEIQGDTGNRLVTTQAITSIERDDEQLAVTTQEVSLIPEDPNAERFIYIDNDSLNLNMRTIHDTLYAAPVGTETIRFVISSGVYVGSATLGVYSLRTGSWPAGVTLRFDNHGICEGIAGNGGAGGRGNGHNPPANGSPGANGGDALFVEYALSIDNLDGSLWGGGGGGGGGGGSVVVGSGGGGGGSGAGYNTGTGGQGGQNTDTPLTYEASGANGTRTTPGAGAPGFNSGGGYVAGSGGTGGGPGLAGTAGTNATKNPGGPSTPGTGGAAGAAGKYVQGNSLVTWINNGDRRGGVA